MNPYNGFTPAQRSAALRWLNGEYAGGRRVRPTICQVCGQRQGLIEAHSEDYSGPPYGDNIGAFGLCYRCHMMIHCRFGAPQAFEAYVQTLEAGMLWPPTGRAWGTITRMLDMTPGPLAVRRIMLTERHAPRTEGDPEILRRIVAGAYRPRRPADEL